MPRLLLLLVVLLIQWRAQAQLVDPSFLPARIYQPGVVRQVVEQPDGKILLIGTFTRIAGQDAPPSGLVRLMPGGNQIDTVFQRNTQYLTAGVRQFLLLANGKILLNAANSPGPVIQLGNVTRQALLRLNSDGTPDPTFNAGTGPNAYIVHMLEQPDGHLLLSGAFTQFNGAPKIGIVRLFPDGALEPFQSPQLLASSAGVAAPASVYYMALQSDGKILVGGRFTGSSANNRQGSLIRLLPTGAQDLSFQTAAYSGGNILAIAVRPDNTFYVLGELGNLRRLQANGLLDNSFAMQTIGSYSLPDDNWVPGNALIHLVPGSNRVLVCRRGTLRNGWNVGGLIALTPAGTLDPTFDNLGAAPRSPLGMCLTAAGKILVAGQGQRYGSPSATATPTALALLQANGSRDGSLKSQIHNLGQVSTVVLQPDGKLIVGGNFTEINGLAVPGGLARLHTDGLPDSLYSNRASANDDITSLALQPDGKLVVTGDFSQIGGGSQPYIARLTTSGMLDSTFRPVFSSGSYPYFSQVAVQPDGRLLVRGRNINWNPAPLNRNQNVVRLFGNGQIDLSFQVSSFNATNFLPQPDGRIVASGTLAANSSTRLWRWLANGRVDSSFSVATPSSIGNPIANLLAQDARGRTYFSYVRYVAGNSNLVAEVVRALPDGRTDTTFSYSYNPADMGIDAVTVQPNERLLLATTFFRGTLSQPGSTRLLDSGVDDPSFQYWRSPTQRVSQMLVQPDGAIIMAGSFRTVSGLPINGLARLLDTNVLRVSSQRSAIQTSAYPVPAHGELHIALEATAQPQQVKLLDALGRTVLQHKVNAASFMLNTSFLPAGAYILRVEYASDVATRRVVLE
ncbi:T9SS type A sorting domain-containing protein [Hymenobacter sp. ASUV-10]|uniref:T9SS type A sorting domain-containing protein n=1 Tax=Hymenobacter aranciens TaxID=3063996 RepID=A0ABT9BA14_9BACT|nr:T9SS type A sorting domain-containing protein [Hymenobacter sp. ASUV-10]MDO7875104.1 T9SS type A sorting domain-containing protein [Hymenobacter sp. ASUV-10]